MDQRRPTEGDYLLGFENPALAIMANLRAIDSYGAPPPHMRVYAPDARCQWCGGKIQPTWSECKNCGGPQ